ncbi:nudix hydrolase [Pectobacterium phage POP12]|nr:nudix hydrolase [Pectobacterium phage POP12]
MEISAGILFVKNQSILMGHATETDHWDIPKGHVESHETFIAAAIRECREETGFAVDKKDLAYAGLHNFSSNKMVALYLYTGEKFPDHKTCVCTSMFEKEGRMIPEMDDFKYVPFEKVESHVGQSLNTLLKTIFKL